EGWTGRRPASGCGSAGGRASACAPTSCSPRSWAKSWTSGSWPPSSSSSGTSQLLQLRLDRRDDALAVLGALLVVADLAQLGRGEVGEARLHLGGRQLVVGRDREVRPDAGSAAQAVGLGERAVGRIARHPCGAAAGGPDPAP